MTKLTQEEQDVVMKQLDSFQDKFNEIANKHVPNIGSMSMLGGIGLVKQKILNPSIELPDDFSTEMFEMTTAFTDEGMTQTNLFGVLTCTEDTVVNNMKTPHPLMRI